MFDFCGHLLLKCLHSLQRQGEKQKYKNIHIKKIGFTAPFNNMQALKFEAQPTNAFFAAVNQMFGGSS